MSSFIHGIKKLAIVDPEDIEVFYSYTKTRTELGNLVFEPLFYSSLNNILKTNIDGIFKLKLPSNIFNEEGFYTLVIKPRSIKTKILDCSKITINTEENSYTLYGIVIDKIDNLSSLNGYFIDYFDNQGNLIKNRTKFIAQTFKIMPQAPGAVVGQTNTYIIDNNGNYLFLVIEPSTNVLGEIIDIGQKNQEILITNSFFEPVVLEVELTEHTIKTLSYALYGNSVRENDTGNYYIFDENNKVFKKYNLITVKSKFGRGTVDYKQEDKNVNPYTTFEDLL